DVNPVNLLTLALLGTPRHAMGEVSLHSQISLFQHLLTNPPTPELITVTDKTPKEIIAYGFEMKMLQRQPQSMNDVISLLPEKAVGLTYFRNNVAHLLALPSLVACCFLEHHSFSMSTLQRLALSMHPFLQSELFLPWGED